MLHWSLRKAFLSLFAILWNSAFRCLYLSFSPLLFISLLFTKASLVAQMVKRLPAMWETGVRFLGRDDALEKEMAIHSSTLAWKIPWTEVHDIVQKTGIKTIPIERKCKKVKWLSGEALQIAVKRREAKSKGERQDISIWMQSSKE